MVRNREVTFDTANIACVMSLWISNLAVILCFVLSVRLSCDFCGEDLRSVDVKDSWLLFRIFVIVDEYDDDDTEGVVVPAERVAVVAVDAEVQFAFSREV